MRSEVSVPQKNGSFPTSQKPLIPSVSTKAKTLRMNRSREFSTSSRAPMKTISRMVKSQRRSSVVEYAASNRNDLPREVTTCSRSASTVRPPYCWNVW